MVITSSNYQERIFLLLIISKTPLNLNRRLLIYIIRFSKEGLRYFCFADLCHTFKSAGLIQLIGLKAFLMVRRVEVA